MVSCCREWIIGDGYGDGYGDGVDFTEEGIVE